MKDRPCGAPVGTVATRKELNRLTMQGQVDHHTSTEYCELQIATCRCDLKCSTEHSSDCGSVATEFLKISELYRHNCACGSDW